MLATDRRLDRRVVFEAGILSEAGARVTIVSRDPDPGGRAGHALPAGVVTIQYQNMTGRPFPLRGLAVALWRRLSSRLPGDLAFAPHTGALLARAAALPADLVHAHDLDTLPAALSLKRSRGIPLVYDAHEFLSASVRRRLGDAPLAERLLSIERRLSSLADRRIAVTAPLSALMNSELREGPAFVAVENLPPAPDPEEFAAGRRLFAATVGEVPGGAGGAARFVDAGSVETFRNPSALFAAAKRLPPGREIWMARMGPEVALAERAAREAGGALRLFDPVPPRLLGGFLSGFHAGLVSISGIDRYYARMGPNRLYDCLCAGLPVVGDPSLLSVREALRAGAGIPVDMADPAALARELAGFPGSASRAALREAVARHEKTLRDRSRSALLRTFGEWLPGLRAAGKVSRPPFAA